MIVAKGFLHGVKFPVGRQTFDGCHIGALHLQRERGAGFDGIPVDMDDAGTALAGVTTDVGAREAKFFAKQLNQQCPVFDFGRNRLAVHRKRNGGHVILPRSANRIST